MLILAPLILPQIILAIGLYPIMAKLGIIGTTTGLIMAHVVVSVPLVYITVAAALNSYPPTYELAAMTLGANWWKTFWHVTFPMIRLGVAVGAILAFAFSFDELILALFLASPEVPHAAASPVAGSPAICDADHRRGHHARSVRLIPAARSCRLVAAQLESAESARS